MRKEIFRNRNCWKRLAAYLIVLALTLGLLPVYQMDAGAVTSVEEAIQKATEWGFMRDDIPGSRDPSGSISRAEFVTIVNRAFGYKTMGGEPFVDVSPTDWYGQDVDIAYTEGYIYGTTPTTFSPMSNLTREQAVMIIARNLRMQGDPGEDISFSDSRQLSQWSRGVISEAVRYGIIHGYSDGTFRPKNIITRGAAAVVLVNAVGTPIQTAGVHTLGGVYGNLTITASGVTLRDTVVAGNLYITDGVDLGSVTLENVRVLGQIVITGGGDSESGDDSFVLRNVDAQGLTVDALRGKRVSVRVEGDGVISTATFRTDAYVEDNTPDDAGLSKIVLDGDADTALSVAGNLKEVVNITPGAALNLVRGTAAVITVDEAAVGSTLHLEAGSLADQVNLDVGTTVTGDGNIGHLTVNAAGSTVPMLPDQITIRPGITAGIGGETMDSTAAAESSADPRLLGGYPSVTDLAPTSATATYSGNKSGTVYWAVTPITAGSVGAEDLITPPAYTNTIVRNGSVSLTGSGAEAAARLTSLTSGGSYYLSAVLVDARQEQSPVKVVSFSTPDNSVPAFASGYPYMSRITNTSAQVTVMATKTCQLYYAVLPNGASAPTADDFLSNAIPGNLGFGSIPVTKNTEYSFDVSQVLEELKSYNLYLWLTDLDGGRSSSVQRVSFTTVDRTPPEFRTPATVNRIQATSVGLYANLNENGTLYWVVVAEGTAYPKPLPGDTSETEVDLTSDNAKLQVSSGMSALRSGRVTMRANQDVSFNVTGLEAEKAYDLYYVAQDAAGNYSASVQKITIHTLDETPPTVTQEFTRFNGTDTTHPLPDTNIRIVFSESVLDVANNVRLTDLYQAVLDAGTDSAKEEARDHMAEILRGNIQMFEMVNGIEQAVTDRSVEKDADDWTVDYRYAQVTTEEGCTVVTFPTNTANMSRSALNLKSGSEYYFRISGIADTSSNQNPMGVTNLDRFTTVFAQVNLSASGNTETTINDTDYRIDAYWRLSPVSTNNVADSIRWDMLIWMDTTADFTLWTRKAGDTKWTPIGDPDSPVSMTVNQSSGEYSGVSLTMNDNLENKDTFDPLRGTAAGGLTEGTVYEYAISFISVNGDSTRGNWSGTVNLRVNVVAGENYALAMLANNVIESNWDQQVGNGVTNIGLPETLELHAPFQEQSAPEFDGGYPRFQPGDSSVNMGLMLDRQGTVYYVVAPLGNITTEIDGTRIDEMNYASLPETGADPVAEASIPTQNSIVNGDRTYANNDAIKTGSLTVRQGATWELVEGLEPRTKYIAYFVIQGTAQVYSKVYCYRFATGDVDTPVLEMQGTNETVGFRTDQNANVNYALFAYSSLPSVFTDTMILVNGESMTVLEAMLTASTEDDKSSLLDEYDGTNAESIRTQVREYITRSTASGGTPAAASSMVTTADSWADVDFTNAMREESGTYYYCLAVAQNVLGGAYTFRAVSNVHIGDNTPTRLTSANTVVTNDSDGLYSGTLTLAFSESLYYVPEVGGEKASPVYNVANDSAASGGISLVDHLYCTPGNVRPYTTMTTVSNTFALYFSNVRIGSVIRIFNDGFISDASSNSTRRYVTLEFRYVPGGTTGTGDFIRNEYQWVIVEQ